MMFLTANPLLPTSKRNLIRDMGMDGNVWWGLISGVSSLTRKEHSYISHWRLSNSSSSKGLLLPHPPLESRAWCLVVEKTQENGEKNCGELVSKKCVFHTSTWVSFSCFFFSCFLEVKYVERKARWGRLHGL